MILNAFKTAFKLLQKDNKSAQKCFEKASQNRTATQQDPAQFDESVRRPFS